MARTYRCPDDHPHGTTRCYAHGCGCTPCREANNAAQRAYRRRPKTGAPRAVDAARATARVRALRAQGWTVREIVLASGVSTKTVSDLVRGVRDRVTPDVEAMLTHRLARPQKTPRGHVDATGTRRRLQALTAHGWQINDVARLMGRDRQNVRRLYNRDHCERSSRDAVAALFAEMWDKPAPPKTRNRARALAARHGWVGALAWENIDDPNEKPVVAVEAQRDERGSTAWRLDEAEVLHSSGESVEHVMRVLGTNRAAFARLARNHHRPDLARWAERTEPKGLAA